jgi:hypothetical protein
MRAQLARIRAAINTAADFGDLVSIAGKYLIAVARIDQNAGEIAERQIATANGSTFAAIVRHEEALAWFRRRRNLVAADPAQSC